MQEVTTSDVAAGEPAEVPVVGRTSDIRDDMAHRAVRRVISRVGRLHLDLALDWIAVGIQSVGSERGDPVGTQGNRTGTSCLV